MRSRAQSEILAGSKTMLQFYQPDKDYGTPFRQSQDQVALTIDGVAVEVPEGSSVMHAAAQAGIKVPKLCATDSPG